MATIRGFSAFVSCQHSLVTIILAAQNWRCVVIRNKFSWTSTLRHVCVRHCCDHHCWVVSQARIVAMR